VFRLGALGDGALCPHRGVIVRSADACRRVPATRPLSSPPLLPLCYRTGSQLLVHPPETEKAPGGAPP
jgi:hypothetical protein